MALLTMDQQTVAIPQRQNGIDVVRFRGKPPVPWGRMIDVGEGERNMPTRQQSRPEERLRGNRQQTIRPVTVDQLRNTFHAGYDELLHQACSWALRGLAMGRCSLVGRTRQQAGSNTVRSPRQHGLRGASGLTCLRYTI